MYRYLKFIITGFVVFFTTLSAFAQPTLVLSDATVPSGSITTIDASVMDFTDITKMQYSLNWNTAELEFIGIASINMDNALALSDANIDASGAAMGNLVFSWEDPNGVGMVLEDGMNFFSIEFRALIAEGETTEVSFTDTPSEIIINRNISGNANIYDPVRVPPRNGTITATTGIPDVFFNFIPTEPLDVLCKGDQICYDLTVSGFVDIISVTAAISWDSSVIKFVEARDFSSIEEDKFQVPVDSLGNFDSIANFLYFDDALATLTLPDSSKIFTLCYEVVGEPNSTTTIKFLDSKEKATEIVDELGVEYDVFQLNNPTINVSDCQSIISFTTDCKDIKAEETVCIDFTTTNFQDITNLKYTVTYDPTLLEFVQTENYNLNGLTAANFSDNSGVLVLDWSSPTGETVADGDFLFAACFKAIGPVDSISSLTYLPLAGNGFNVENSSGESLEPQFFGCEVQILPPTVSITAGTVAAPPGEEICIPLTVTNFQNITHVEMPIEWDPTVLEYVTINTVGLTGLSSADFEIKDVIDGKLQLITWDSPTDEGITLPDGSTIFEVCFRVTGELGDETAIALPVSNDNPPFVINSSGKFPDVAPVNGQVTVAAGGLVLESMPTEVLEDESFCVDITARNFNNIVSLQYTHIYDSTVLNLDSIVIRADQVLQTEDISAIGSDQIAVAWISEDPVAGNTIADGTVLYSLCFTAKAAIGRCSNFALDETQEVTTVESAGDNVGIFNNIGDICVDNFGLIVSDSLHPKCGIGEGLLTLDVPGDPGESFFYFVSKDGQQFINNQDVENGQIILTDLAEGVYSVRLTSLSDLSKTVTKVYDLSLSDSDLPMVDLGDDLDAGCIEQGTPIDLTIDASDYTLPQNAGGVISTTWVVSGTEGMIEGDTSRDVVNVVSTGTYIFTVLVSNTNCSASDTISVIRAQPPRVQVVKGGTLGCTNSTVQLGIEVFNPEENPNATFSWSTEDGNIVNENTLLDPVVDQEGLYKFTVIDTLNNCIVSDSTFIIEDRIKPVNVDAGQDREMGCEDDFLRLTGTGDPGTVGEWSTPNGSSIANPNADSLQIADVTRVGTYIFTATNPINGCATSDTMMINADESLPVAQTADLVIIGCDTTLATLDGSNSSVGAVFTYRWEDPNNELISTENITTTETAGDYLFIVTNNNNADCISDSITVVVREDKAEPQVSIPNSITFSCMTECTPLSAVVPEGDNYTYEWTTDDGVLCGGEDSSTVMISSIGVYKIIVTNTENNCVSTTPTIIGGDGTQIFAETGPDRLIDCQNDVVTLDGRGSDTGSPTLVFSWENEAGIEISNETTVDVSEPGEYTLNVIDTETGCDAVGKVSVTIDQEKPFASAGDGLEITGCEFPTGSTLNGEASDQGTNIAYSWTSTSGNLVGDTTVIAPEISGPGRFVLTVTNRINGCSSTDEVLVQSDVIIPIANAGTDQEINCDQPEVTLAGLSEELPSGSEINWTTSDGNIIGEADQLAVMVDAAGTYTLTIVSPDGCSASDEVVVDASNLDIPEANAGQERMITCNQPLIINGTGAMGPNIAIEWTTIGGSIASGGDTYTPEVNRGGSYTLTVTNTETNCKNTSVVLIIDEGDLPVANAGDNQEICINETTLMAELPTGFEGTWRTLEQSMVVSPNDANTSVADLEEGENTYLWTLSSDECGAFSTDTVVVNVPTLPFANDDQFEIQPGQSFSSLDLIQNDQINSDNFTVNILEQPTTGSLSEVGDGIFEFTTPARYFGTQQFQYEVCNATCSNLCSIANVRVVVLPGADVDTTNTVPNAITPNGDGMNDMLLVDELIFDAVDFPKSEMVIFNRWGDIVFRASPYNNDWQGQSNNGDELPEGTYYYVLRLDISEGEVMKGDITILR